MTDPSRPIVPVILSGGSGTRLWPASREHRPKQLLPLTGSSSLIQATIERVDGLDNVAPPIVVTNEEHAEAVRRSLRDAGIEDATLILEPVGRNTAPAVAAAAMLAVETGDDPLLLVLPADHAIANPELFGQAVTEAARVAADGFLVTFGITPTSAETGYGYIRTGHPVSGRLMQVAEFKEKPNAATAAAYVASGEYSWNSGMFLMPAQRYLDELGALRPDIVAATSNAFEYATRDPDSVSLAKAAFSACPAESIDYAVMEHTDRAAVLPIDVGWSDVGSWASLWEISPRDENGNVSIGDVLAMNTTNSYLSGGGRVMAVVGLDEAVVIDTPDALLVTCISHSQYVREMVAELKKADRQEVVTDGTVVAPWGTCRPISVGVGHAIRDVAIDAGAAMPLQTDATTSHHLQAMSGRGTVQIGSSTIDISSGLSVLVEAGAPWTVTNSGEQTLRITQISVDTVFGNEEPTE